MGEARRKQLAGLDQVRPPTEKLRITLTGAAHSHLQQAHASLTEAQTARKLPTVSFDLFCEHLLMWGLERLKQALATGDQRQPSPDQERLVLTPEEYKGKRTPSQGRILTV